MGGRKKGIDGVRKDESEFLRVWEEGLKKSRKLLSEQKRNNSNDKKRRFLVFEYNNLCAYFIYHFLPSHSLERYGSQASNGKRMETEQKEANRKKNNNRGNTTDDSFESLE
ncbi:hypothetical protein AVEN_55931-1 [Araneus ventricosus]|uniref:Uncharacterized protein n=1 Tax=Araneus ventricosus TaxID=182803 RepID=A0A4Y2LXD4_ARAVE|nr:hypothetical protein AVEN_55931-1 [Araneus ventricosus]